MECITIWIIVCQTNHNTFKEGKIKYVYFIAETKGTNESTELKSMEQAKIKCAEKLFEKLSNGEVHYGQVKDYKSLMDIVLDR